MQIVVDLLYCSGVAAMGKLHYLGNSFRLTDKWRLKVVGRLFSPFSAVFSLPV